MVEENFSNETEKMEKILEDNEKNANNEPENLYSKQFEKLEKEIQKTQIKGNYIINQLKTRWQTIRVHEDFDKYISVIHKTLLLNNLKNKKNEALKREDLFKFIFSYAKSLNENKIYIEWVEEYNKLTVAVPKYSFEDIQPYYPLLKGKHTTKSYEFYEDQVNMLRNLSTLSHVYRISTGDILLVMMAKFIQDKKELSDYRQLSDIILTKWKQCTTDFPKKFYDVNLKIVEDLNKNYYELASINIILKYIEYVIDFTNGELLKTKDKNYDFYIYHALINDMYENIKIAIMKLYEKKDLIYEFTDKTFDISILENLKKKLELIDKLK